MDAFSDDFNQSINELKTTREDRDSIGGLDVIIVLTIYIDLDFTSIKKDIEVILEEQFCS